MTEAQGDRELSEWLLENLLCWRRPEHPDTRAREVEYTEHVHANITRNDRWLAPPHRLVPPLPDPDGSGSLPDLTGSGDGMLLVLEAMRERGYYSSLHCINNPLVANWSAHVPIVVGDDMEVRDIVEYHDSAPMAVALATRAALEAEGGRDA